MVSTYLESGATLQRGLFWLLRILSRSTVTPKASHFLLQIFRVWSSLM